MEWTRYEIVHKRGTKGNEQAKMLEKIYAQKE